MVADPVESVAGLCGDGDAGTLRLGSGNGDLGDGKCRSGSAHFKVIRGGRDGVELECSVGSDLRGATGGAAVGGQEQDGCAFGQLAS
jgi:hypothetical protein